MPHVCHKINRLVKLLELCVCLIFLLCCNHFTLMLYYRQHLCVALSAEANVFEIGFLLPAGTQNAAHNISYWSTASNNQLPLVFFDGDMKSYKIAPPEISR